MLQNARVENYETETVKWKQKERQRVMSNIYTHTHYLARKHRIQCGNRE